MYSLGFLGAGQMGGAILGGLRSKTNDTRCLFFEPSAVRSRELTEKFQAEALNSIGAVFAESDDVIVAVKPQIFPSLKSELCAGYRKGQILLSIMAGVPLSALKEGLPEDAKIIRLMPNMAMTVGQGVCLLTANENVTEEEKHRVISLLSVFGLVKEIPEKLMNAGTAVSGSGPAFFFAMAEAMMLGGIRVGFAKNDALELTVQTMLGAAQLLAETEAEASVLRNQTLSAGGTTIAGIHVLEKAGFSGAVMDAVEAACCRGEEMSKGDGKK